MNTYKTVIVPIEDVAHALTILDAEGYDDWQIISHQHESEIVTRETEWEADRKIKTEVTTHFLIIAWKKIEDDT